MSSNISSLFDYIFIFNNIQEQENIESFLLKASKNLSPNGSILLTYPNALSVHRIIAKGLGVINDINSEKSDNSKKYGDFHLLTNKKIRDAVSAVNLKIKLEDGIFFKPFTNAVLEKLDEKKLDFFNSLSYIYPENCALNFVEITR
jgi:2-polyprenyl-3-methyl-5-hydroxy-6-metoxy-1,4-benzoquinol methylase